MTAPDCDRACGCRAEVERLREQERLAKERAEAVEASYHRMLPVYEAAMKWNDYPGPGNSIGEQGLLVALHNRCRRIRDEEYEAALAADRDMEGES